MAELSNNEAGRGYTDVIRLTYEDLQSIGNAGQQTIATIPAGGAVELAGVHEATAVAGTTTLVIDVGTTSGDPDEFIVAELGIRVRSPSTPGKYRAYQSSCS